MRQVGKGLKALYQCPLEFLGFWVEHQPSLLVMSIIELERGVGTHSFGIALFWGQKLRNSRGHWYNAFNPFSTYLVGLT
jgi:hypothetical protein